MIAMPTPHLVAHAIDPSLAGVITAVFGGIAVVGGLILNRLSLREQARQQAAADKAARDSEKAGHLELALDAMQRRAEMAEAGELNWRRRAESQQTENDKQREQHRRREARLEARCREQTALLTDALIVLRGVVVDETAQAAAATVLDRRLPHPHDPPELEQRDPGDES